MPDPCAPFFFRLVAVVLLFSGPALAQTTPEVLHTQLVITPVAVAEGTPVRIAHDPSTDFLYYLTLQGDLYRMAPPYGSQTPTRVYTSADHGVGSNVLGLAISTEGTLYVVGNRPQGGMNSGIIVRGDPTGNGDHRWSTVVQTEPYPMSGTVFDHNFNGIALSPDGTTLYVNSGSRTDHGEAQDNDGQFPVLREIPLTSALFRIPADTTDLTLPADEDTLLAHGFLYADGLRNSFDLAFDTDGRLFATENAGDRNDNEELNWIREGHHYGFPWHIGSSTTPQQFADYDPAQDPLLPPEGTAVRNGYFYTDPNYPAPPEGVSFTAPVRNLGPDANLYHDPADGVIYDADDTGVPISTFTPHRSPLGLVFDTANQLPAGFTGSAFVLSWTAPTDPLMARFGDEGGDLLELTLAQEGDAFTAKVHRRIKGFSNPIDAVLVRGKLYILTFGGAKQIWEVTFLTPTATEDPLPPDPALEVRIYPNPAVDHVGYAVQINTPQFVEVALYTTLGQRAAVLFSGYLQPGPARRFAWDRAGWPAGTYFLRVTGAKTTHVKPVLLAR